MVCLKCGREFRTVGELYNHGLTCHSIRIKGLLEKAAKN